MSAERPGCFKIGCLAVVVLVMLGVIVVTGIATVAWTQARNPETTSPVLEPSLPAVELAGEAEELAPAAAGRIVLDLRGAGFHVEPTLAGQPLRVEATFDERHAELEESLEEGADGAWVYRVRFRRKGSMLVGMVSQLFGAPQPEVRVLIPPDLPHQLEIAVGQGAAEIELGGLWLTGLRVDMDQGGMVLEISEPLREPIGEMVIEGEMGGLVASSLGNASPERLTVDYRMGGVEVDLRGAWRRDGHVAVTVEMGGGQVTLPDDVTVSGVPTDRPPVVWVEGPEAPRPVVTIEISGEDVEVVDRARRRSFGGTDG